MKGKLLWVLVCCISGIAMQADDSRTCLIFSGGAEKEYALDLNRYNRITFGENSMTVTSSTDPDARIELFYSAYHHLEVGLAQISGIETIGETEVALVYDTATSSLRVEAPEDQIYAVGVFGLNGVMVRHADVGGGGSLALESLQPGVYIAVAAGKNEAIKIKFVK